MPRSGPAQASLAAPTGPRALGQVSTGFPRASLGSGPRALGPRTGFPRAFLGSGTFPRPRSGPAQSSLAAPSGPAPSLVPRSGPAQASLVPPTGPALVPSVGPRTGCTFPRYLPARASCVPQIRHAPGSGPAQVPSCLPRCCRCAGGVPCNSSSLAGPDSRNCLPELHPAPLLAVSAHSPTRLREDIAVSSPGDTISRHAQGPRTASVSGHYIIVGVRCLIEHRLEKEWTL